MKHELDINEFMLDEIVAIELIGDEDTIDISVDDAHMFYANDIYTHNSSISSEIVNTDQMGGSIKKAQIGHVIISIAKTLLQKEHKLATMVLLKSRIGDDGIVFENCGFNNEYLDINTETQNTLLGHEEDREKQRQARVQEVFRKQLEAEELKRNKENKEQKL